MVLSVSDPKCTNIFKLLVVFLATLINITHMKLLNHDFPKDPLFNNRQKSVSNIVLFSSETSAGDESSVDFQSFLQISTFAQCFHLIDLFAADIKMFLLLIEKWKPGGQT